ncbi:MAG: penicillin acylase family protein [Acetobacteraceae bacterium]|nr:penicillin acylase family protein [Acetobacteraceae bacterium]
MLTGLFLAILALLVFAAVGIGGALWWSLPSARMQARIPGLSEPVAIDFDTHGIPRIRARSMVDAIAALGFLHARDRMFQLELMRRAASGRLSEISGTPTLAFDRQMRTLGLARAARADLPGLQPETRVLLAAYARGVNAWINARGRFAAPEFIWLGKPEAWEDWHGLLWAKTMGLWLSENWRTELSRLALDGKLSRDRIYELWPQSNDFTHVDGGRHTAREEAETASALLEALPPPLPGQASTASNEWAVDGRHSATGAPLVAGDPHLMYAFPGIWYLARIETPGDVLVGATASGAPGVVIGHNGHVAWTFTTTAADVQDVFIETEVDADHYQTPDGPKPYLVHEEHIHVRGQAGEILRVRETRHGPVISDITQRAGGPILAVSMANLMPGDTSADGLVELNRARNMEEAGTASARISGLVQNLLVADRTRIGLFVTGRVPIRRAGDGSWPVDGTNSTHDWIGWATGAQLPRYIDPPSGVLVNANDRIAPDDFPVFLGRDWFGDFRARRIRTMLETPHPKRLGKHDLDSFTRMQLDTTSTLAQQILPVLRAIPAPTGLTGHAFGLLAAWNGEMLMDLPQPLIFNAWMRYFRRAVLDAALVPQGVISPELEFLAFVLSSRGTHWCDNRTAMLTRTLEQAVAELSRLYGTDPGAWRWGVAHESVFANPLLRHIPLLGRFSTVRIASPGDTSTVNRATLSVDGYEAVHGPGYRGVYDLADLERSRFIVTPGQSAHWLSRHAGDLATHWRDGKMLELGPRPAGTPVAISLVP